MPNSGVPNPEDSPDAGVTWHFGDPFGEQRAAVRSSAIIDRSHRGIITLTGADRLSWLHSITSQDTLTLPPGETRENLSLDANGRVEDHFLITDTGSVTYLETEPHRAAPFAAYLTKMVFWADVQVSLRTDLALLTLVGPDAGTHAQACAASAGADVLFRPSEQIVDIVIPREHRDTAWDASVAAGARPAGTWAFEALRVAAVIPRLGLDTDEKTIPHEVGWISRAVHLDKGCYRGQETVARVHNLGKPPRVLVLLQLDGSADTRAATGDSIEAAGRSVGRVGTVVEHFEYGPIALALIKRSVPVDAALDVAGASVTIDPDSYPAPDGEPQLGRLAVDRLRGR